MLFYQLQSMTSLNADIAYALNKQKDIHVHVTANVKMLKYAKSNYEIWLWIPHSCNHLLHQEVKRKAAYIRAKFPGQAAWNGDDWGH